MADQDRMDADSEFSIGTLETDLKHEENVLDLALDKAEYYSNSLLQVVESDVVSEKGFLTFFTVEFYDHDTKATDVSTGLQPSYSTLFSFKNKVDDYYIQFLQSNRLKLEVFVNKAQKVKKIGFANIILRELIEKDYDTMEGMKSPIITGIINIMSSANPSLRIGSIKYKMRMRKSLNEALRWFREKHDLNVAQRSKRVTQKYLNTKVIAINVMKCTDLFSQHATDQSKIQPYFFYNFYTFPDYFSKTVLGENPEYNDIQTFSTEIDSKFKDYTEEKSLEISILDDSVSVGVNVKDVEDESIDDMIGTAHIPLFDLGKGRGIWDRYVVKNLNGDITGMIEVKITVHNSIEEVNMPNYQRMELSADEWGKEFLFKICYRYVDKENIDLNSLFAIFSKGEEYISKQNFRDTIIPKKSGVSESEIDMFMKDCEPFQRRGHMTREEFVSIMRVPFKRAIQEDRIRRKELGQRNDSEDDEDLRRDTQTDKDRHTDRSKRSGRDRESARSKTKDHEDRKSTHRSNKENEHSQRSTVGIEDIKAKIKDFLVQNKISLQLFYEYIDQDGDKRLSMDEFITKFKRIEIDMSEEEAKKLFYYCDPNNSGEVTYREFATS